MGATKERKENEKKNARLARYTDEFRKVEAISSIVYHSKAIARAIH